MQFKNTSFLFLIFYIPLFSQNIKFQVKDADSKENIEFVSVNLLNGTGFYTNGEGKVDADLSGVNTIELTHVSYESKKFEVSGIDSVIYLVPKVNFLKEIKIVGNGSKIYLSQGSSIEKEFTMFHFGTYGSQVAMLIKVDGKKDYFLDEVLIPIAIDNVWKKINNIKEDFATIIKLTFNKNEGGKPSDSILQSPEYVFIDKKMLRKKNIQFKLNSKLRIPEEGLFCTVTMMGKADDNGNLLFEIPTRKAVVNNKMVIFSKYLPVQIPIYTSNSQESDYARNFFGTDLKFYKIVPPILTPPYLNKEDSYQYVQDEAAKMPNYKVNISFKYYFYE